MTEKKYKATVSVDSQTLPFVEATVEEPIEEIKPERKETIRSVWPKPKDGLVLVVTENNEYYVFDAGTPEFDTAKLREGVEISEKVLAKAAKPKSHKAVVETFMPTLRDVDEALWKAGFIGSRDVSGVTLERVMTIVVENIRKRS